MGQPQVCDSHSQREAHGEVDIALGDMQIKAIGYERGADGPL